MHFICEFLKGVNNVIRQQQTCSNCPPVQNCPDTVTISFQDNQGRTSSFQVTAAGPFDGGRTWRYTVKKLEGHNLSHFDVQFCTQATVNEWKIFAFNCTDLLASGTGPDDHFKIMLNGDPATDCFKNIPNIKFDNLGDFAPVTDFCFQFTLDQCYQIACICVDAKAGNNDHCACILGPSPNCVPCPTPPPARGFRIRSKEKP